MNLALAQIRIQAGDVDANRQRALSAVRDAAANGADLVVLPELFTAGFFAFDQYRELAEPIGGPTHRQLANAATDLEIGILAGSIVEDLNATASQTDVFVPVETGLANTQIFITADGSREGVYRKHHLFGYESRENELLEPGERLTVVEYEGLSIGMTTCYDLRFPELYRVLLQRGVELILVPSAWPYPRVEHWNLLPKARAVENLAYVGTANGVGSFAAAELCGRSAVYDPWGTTLAACGDEPALVSATIDPDRVRSVRDEFPALRDRRVMSED